MKVGREFPLDITPLYGGVVFPKLVYRISGLGVMVVERILEYGRHPGMGVVGFHSKGHALLYHLG